MTKLAFFSLNTLIQEKFADLNERKKASSIALGVAVSRLAPVPSSSVQNAEEHWANAVQGLAGSLISCFNEQIVVDVDLALETARGYWLVRYFSAFPCVEGSLASHGEHSFLLKLTGGVRFLNEDTACYCECNQEPIIQLVNRITLLLKAKEEPVGEAEAV